MAAVTISAGVQSGGEGADDFALGIAERLWPAHQFVLEIDQTRAELKNLLPCEVCNFDETAIQIFALWINISKPKKSNNGYEIIS